MLQNKKNSLKQSLQNAGFDYISDDKAIKITNYASIDLGHRSGFIRALEKLNLKTMQAFIQYGILVDNEMDGNLPIGIALAVAEENPTHENSVPMLRLLLAAKADPSFLFNDCETPLSDTALQLLEKAGVKKPNVMVNETNNDKKEEA